jgi:hypothetical protein
MIAWTGSYRNGVCISEDRSSWPPSWPDLSACDYFESGHLKDSVFREKDPHGIQESKIVTEHRVKNSP